LVNLVEAFSLKNTLFAFGLACLASLVLAACAASPTANPTPAITIQVSVTATLPIIPTALTTPSPSPTQPASTLPPTHSPAASPTPTATLACSEPAGRMEISSLESSLLKKPLEYRVWLPPCYNEHVLQRYPVLYLIHGQSYTDDQWDRMGIDETAGRLIKAGEIAPLIIVMPRDRIWGQPEEDPFGDALVEDLIPFIDGHYRTLADRSHRAVGGLSRGAGWALHLGLAHWKLFGAFGAHSLATFWTDAPQLRTWLNEIPAGSLPRIYLDAGDHDRPPILDAARRFEELLTQYSIPHEWYLFPGYHDEAYWSAHLEKYLRWYAAPWKE
jgi:enterochelin esterase-like enzyme